ncbi:hypothetical protein [Okeania sp. KiyG1]|uniref:hypothetical protein n=1 Tax=Okeania sp. KiyG1 TaxID=2720165 RepID=UPI001923470C|nr:hypothetical protein [Okeania sp. KiyG1]
MSLIMRCDPASAQDASGQTPRRRRLRNADQERERAPTETFYIGFMKQKEVVPISRMQKCDQLVAAKLAPKTSTSIGLSKLRMLVL